MSQQNNDLQSKAELIYKDTGNSQRSFMIENILTDKTTENDISTNANICTTDQRPTLLVPLHGEGSSGTSTQLLRPESHTFASTFAYMKAVNSILTASKRNEQDSFSSRSYGVFQKNSHRAQTDSALTSKSINTMHPYFLYPTVPYLAQAVSGADSWRINQLDLAYSMAQMNRESTTLSAQPLFLPPSEIFHNSELVGAAYTKRRKARTVFFDWQIEELEKNFSRNRYISNPDRLKVAEYLNLDETQVKTWFQNRRMKDKKAQKMEGPSHSSSQ